MEAQLPSSILVTSPAQTRFTTSAGGRTGGDDMMIQYQNTPPPLPPQPPSVGGGLLLDTAVEGGHSTQFVEKRSGNNASRGIQDPTSLRFHQPNPPKFRNMHESTTITSGGGRKFKARATGKVTIDSSRQKLLMNQAAENRWRQNRCKNAIKQIRAQGPLGSMPKSSRQVKLQRNAFKPA